jgi:hypothetical protein
MFFETSYRYGQSARHVNACPKTLDDRNFAFLRVLIYLDFVLVILSFLIQLAQASRPHFLSDSWDVLRQWAIITRILSLFAGVFILCWAAVVFATNQRSFRQDLGHYIAAGCAVIASGAVQFLDFRSVLH